MKEFIDKLISMLEEEKQSNPCRNTQCKECKYTNECYEGEKCYKVGVDNIISIVNQLAEEYKGGWIPCSERLPSKEECGAFGSKEFQVTIPQHNGNKTISMHFSYETVRGKEVARWKWRGSISPWEAIAWKPLDAPYTEGE